MEEQVSKENFPRVVAEIIRACLEGQVPREELVPVFARSGINLERAFDVLRADLKPEATREELERDLGELRALIDKERIRRSTPVRRQAAALLREGRALTEVATKMGKSTSELKRLLLLQVGEQELRLSDIFFSIPSEKRETYELIRQRFDNKFSMIQSVRSRRLDVCEFDLYEISRDAPRGDLYVAIADIELALHAEIKQALLSEFGSDSLGWWRKGISVEIRKRCVTTKEEDQSPMDNPYDYTTLIDLWTIMDKNWSIFSVVLPSKVSANKPLLKEHLVRLNSLRNSVMHPVRKAEFGKDDLEFVTTLRESLAPNRWRSAGSG